MSYESSFQQLNALIEGKSVVFNKALSRLYSGAEIRILLEGQHECALTFSGQKTVVENRPARSPDVEFSVYPDAIRSLSSASGDDFARFGIEVVKQIIAGSIHVRVCGSLLRVMTGGYLGIIKEAGPDFMGFLAGHGLKNISKVVSLIKNLKK